MRMGGTASRWNHTVTAGSVWAASTDACGIWPTAHRALLLSSREIRSYVACCWTRRWTGAMSSAYSGLQLFLLASLRTHLAQHDLAPQHLGDAPCLCHTTA